MGFWYLLVFGADFFLRRFFLVIVRGVVACENCVDFFL